MPIDPDLVSQFLGDPPAPDSTEVRVSSGLPRGFGIFDGPSIAIDYRSYIFYGHTILACGVTVPTRFEIDTRSPTLLIGLGTWHLAATWYRPFEPEALKVLDVAPEEARPFSWRSNVPIQTIEEPPYREGQILHGRVPPAPYKPPSRVDYFPAPTPRRSAKPRKVRASSPTNIDLEPGETVRWSCRAWTTSSLASGELVLTSRRLLYRPPVLDRFLRVRPFEVGIREVTDVGCKRVRHLRSAGRAKLGLRLELVGDREQIFVVDSVIKAIEEFSKAITRIGG